MRTANDGRGDEPWDDPTTAPSSDDEATQVFSRGAYVPASSGAEGAEGTRAFSTEDDATRAFSADDETTREFRRDEVLAPGATATQGVSADRPAADDAVFTRRFVRERPRPRTRVSPPPAPALPEEGFPEEEFPRAPEPAPRRRPEPPSFSRPRRRVRRRFRLRWLVSLLLVTALAVPVGTWAWVWYVARQDERTTSDAIVVLGASQYNGVPSPVFEARLRHAQVLYLEGVAPVIVTVGGKLPGDNFTEAASGRNWLIEVGVPGAQIIAVEEGSDTLQSIDAVAEVFEANSWDTAILVSDPWHSLRSERMAADHGIEAGTSPSRSGPAVIERRTQLWYITRETAALWYYWIFDDSSDIQVDAA
ncbi:YdcF family protein [Nocardiopsis dassonvillei]|uniref:YdcF family protein n=1 Tax=Nocardiopsis dassonvillei TaxID=2014 RepID=UPI00200E055F|nr:YdcF family protein [Nocardiopsis dassonvillei]MCK9873504.1 YdcF family protein [Nocardiopsis dassonvillei]